MPPIQMLLRECPPWTGGELDDRQLDITALQRVCIGLDQLRSAGINRAFRRNRVLHADARVMSHARGSEAREVGVRMRQFPNGGFWAMLVCPRCGGGSQRLRLIDGQPACGRCIRASGLIYRSQSVRTEKRHMVTAPPRIALLNSDKPLRVHTRPGRMLDGRANLEIALRRSLIVARQFEIDEHKKMLKDHE
jgi:hypothetical protein